VEELTCPAPLSVPRDLAKPSRGYRRRVAWAFISLLGFIATYLALTAYFVWSVYRMVAGAVQGGHDDGVAIVTALPMAFLALFMLKALFFRDRADKTHEIEIDAAREPRLFAFLLRIADQAGAPRPHRVFLSTRVNAGVFYDLSVLNLLFPSRKNLDIGLGLINALTLGEVRAVLAHEFGHFAQGAMAVGRWVHVAQRVASHIVHKRDAFDRFLRGISGIDLRIAWIGWGMRLIVWALRAVLDSVFSVVVRAERALSHEMERQADLVAVTLTGSDALVHALHKLGAADLAFDQALDVAARKHAKGQDVDDLFALQTRVLEHGRRVLADASHGAAPPLPAEGRAQHRLFEERIAHPPRMWSTHPPNREREDNIKRTYVPCDLDDRPAWLLFTNPEATRTQLTEALLGVMPKPPGGVRKLTREEGLKAVDDSFDHAYFDPRFRGAYLGRSSVRGARTPADLYLPPERARELALDQLYPEDLRRALEKWKSLESEVAALRGLQRGVLQSGGADIRFRGEALRRQDLPRTLEKVRAECAAARAALEERDREHRSAHLAAAERIGQGWPEYLRSLAALLHYADHSEADLRDARGYVANVVAIATADGRVSASEQQQIAWAGREVHQGMNAVWQGREQVRLPEEIAKALGVERWSAALPDEFPLTEPSTNALGQWLEVIDSWLDAFIGPLDALERATLEALLRAEEKVAAFARDPAAAAPAPPPAAAPAQYPTLVPGSERERQWKLGWWDRFQTADGFMPSLARFAVAGGMVAGILMLGASVGDSAVVVYNGLGRDVIVHAAGQDLRVAAFSKERLRGPIGRHLHIVTETAKGEPVETFDTPVERSFQQYVYSVAGAAPLLRWTAVYGHWTPEPERFQGAPRWTTTDATVLFEQPPERVSTKGGGAMRTVLQALVDVPVENAIAELDGPEERARVIRLHALWDEPTRAHTGQWLYGARALPDLAAILKARLDRDPHDIQALRLEQDQPDAAAKAEACARHTRMSAAAPGDVDLRYLAIRCLPRGRERSDAMVAAAEAAPDNSWLALSAGYVHVGRSDWPKALGCWGRARENPALADRLLLDSARVMRLVGPSRERELHTLSLDSPQLRHLLAFEEPGNKGLRFGPQLAYAKLASGALDQAVTLASGDEKTRARVVRLVAASRGATREQLAAARALAPDAGIDYHTLWPAIGLALREKRDASALIARIKEFTDPDERAGLEAFLRPARLAGDAAAARDALSSLDPDSRGHAYVLGCVILGDDAPDEWRAEARALLFAPERPAL
jgi:Zn-dependent protease with chaperone function